MVGMATRANNYHISGSGIWGKGNQQYSGITVLKKNVNEWGQMLHRCCREDFGPLMVQLVFEDKYLGCQD